MNLPVNISIIAAIVCSVLMTSSIWVCAHSLMMRSFRLTVASVVCLLTGYGMLQVFYLVAFPQGGAQVFTMGDIYPKLILCAGYASLVIALIVYDRRFGMRHITQEDIKRFADCMHSGILYYRENGRIILSNSCMMDICLELTGNTLLNGAEFAACLPQGYLTLKDGTVWDFSLRRSEFDGDPLYELIALDVTDVHSTTVKLSEENKALANMTGRMKQYSLHIDETVRAREILDAKIHIHDTMNRLMLTTASAVEGENSDTAAIMRMWKSNAILLCRESAPDNSASSVESYARMLGIRLIWTGIQLKDILPELRDTVVNAAREAIANAVKHADAKYLDVNCACEGGALVCTFKNPCSGRDGVSFGGGLTNIGKLAEKSGGSTEAFISDGFVLKLILPLNAKNWPFGRGENL